MKLTIRRNQADVKGFFGGHKGVMFSLFAKADIKPEEHALIEKYKVGEWVLAKFQIGDGEDAVNIRLTVDSLTNGDTMTLPNLADLQTWETDIKKSCQYLKDALEIMRTFGGEEVIEI